MLTFKGSGLLTQHCIMPLRKQLLEKSFLCWSVMSTDDQEHAETPRRISASSTKIENKHLLQLNTLQKHNFFLLPLGMRKPQEGQKSICGSLFSPFHKSTSNPETILPDLESRGQKRPGRSTRCSGCSHF